MAIDPIEDLGNHKDKASPGDHGHNGEDSPLLLSGVTITGAKAGNTALASIISLLVKLGAKDATT